MLDPNKLQVTSPVALRTTKCTLMLKGSESVLSKLSFIYVPLFRSYRGKSRKVSDLGQNTEQCATESYRTAGSTWQAGNREVMRICFSNLGPISNQTSN